MKKFALLSGLFLLAGCTYTLPVVGEFGRYNETFRGVVVVDGVAGGGTITAKTANSNLTCSGIATAGTSGLIDMTCDDGRRLSGRYQALQIGKGIGQGQDQYGNQFQFQFSMQPEEAKIIEAELVAKKQGRPPLPSGNATKLYLFASEPHDGVESFWEKAEALRVGCAKNREDGKLKGFSAEEACSRDQVRAIYLKGQYPHMDLVDLLIAHRAVMAEQADKGKITDTEFKMRELEIVSKLNTAVMQREDAGGSSSQTVVINNSSMGQALGNAMNNLNQELQSQNM